MRLDNYSIRHPLSAPPPPLAVPQLILFDGDVSHTIIVFHNLCAACLPVFYQHNWMQHLRKMDIPFFRTIFFSMSDVFMPYVWYLKVCHVVHPFLFQCGLYSFFGSLMHKPYDLLWARLVQVLEPYSFPFPLIPLHNSFSRCLNALQSFIQ